MYAGALQFTPRFIDDTMKFPGLLFVITSELEPCVKRVNVDKARVLSVNELIRVAFSVVET
jgi:hypothetical protein